MGQYICSKCKFFDDDVSLRLSKFLENLSFGCYDFIYMINSCFSLLGFKANIPLQQVWNLQVKIFSVVFSFLRLLTFFSLYSLYDFLNALCCIKFAFVVAELEERRTFSTVISVVRF